MPIRLLHFADLHLGIENHGSLDPKTGLSTRVQDFLATLDRLIDYAVTTPVDAVLFAGDAFKNRDPSPTLQRLFAERIRRLVEARIPTVLLVGNHDLPNAIHRATAIDIYQALAIPEIYVARTITTLNIAVANTRLQVVTLPWQPINQLLTHDDIRALSPLELERRFRDLVSQLVQAELEKLDPAYPAVLLGHLSLEGARLGIERNIMLGSDIFFSTAELGLHTAPLDYVALGHIHAHQVISSYPPTVYAGSLERVDFGEENEEKGFVVIDIGDGPYPRAVSWTFHPVPARPFLTLRVELREDMADPTATITRTITRHAERIAGAIVRVIVTGPSQQLRTIRLTDVRRQLLEHGASFVSAILREETRDQPRRLAISAKDAVDPATVLHRWLELQKSLPDNRRQAILERGKAIIAQVQQELLLQED